MGELILIFTPTWIDPATGEDVIAPECEAAIKAQQLRDEYDFDWHVTTDNPYPIGDHRNVLHQYQRAREWFLNCSLNYSALLTIEHDNVLPDSGAVQRMLDTPGDVVYAPYLLRHGKPLLNTWQFVNNRNLGMSLSNYPRELRTARKNVIWKISGAGMGCTLFRRRAIEAIPFTDSSRHNPCPDLGFAEAALQIGFESFGRFDVPVWHYSNGAWLHPFEEYRTMKYLSRVTLNAASNGRFISLVAGQLIDLSEAEAIDLARCGYLEIGDASPLAEPPPAPTFPAQTPVLMAEDSQIIPAQTKRRTPRKAA